jgi:hypothetical protein
MTSKSPAARRGWQNPIFRRYCRSRLRPRGLGVSLLITLLVAGFAFGLSYSIAKYQVKMSTADAARSTLIPVLVIQALILFVFGTAQVAGGITAERDEGVIDYQRLIPMPPLAKVLGYLFGLPVREYVMAATTLPFIAWALWQGNVAFATWFPLYAIFFSTTLLYHFTGLVTGTVVKNRRWAFLVSIGLVFCLYTVIPLMSKFGLVFFKYLTITPVFEECMPDLLPKSAGAVMKAGQQLSPTVKFFNLDFSEAVFTLFSQGGLILTFIIMLCRKWRRAESHLLGKGWAVCFFIWVQVFLLGNALPLVDSGQLFPSRGFKRMSRGILDWAPESLEAMAMSGAYGVVTLGALFLLAGLITPSPETQVRGWRRARKQGAVSLPFFSDAATGTWFAVVMALAGAGGWFLFTRGLVESRWFPGQTVPVSILGYFSVVMLAAGLGFQMLLEMRGGRTVGLATILVGVAPIMVGVVMGLIGTGVIPAASWVVGMSPISLPLYASGGLLFLAELPEPVARSIPRAFYFWLLVNCIATGWLMMKLRAARRTMARRILENG